ncbi:MAG: SusC/RagA family TonB-linked outer membrane protein [Flavobacteriaceae bacterium]|jgi:TonB-linked SusC/RagA family outer membrane protein|nr:SusC/RagA family TonB-linked outer membrane protein [Flavobacteriaceae bacterium]
MTKLQLFSIFSLFFVFSFTVYGQTTVISGKIVDENNNPVVDAVVSIKSGTEETVTNNDGYFELETTQLLPVSIEVNYIEYKEQELEIHNTEPIHIVLSKRNENILDEIVVTALGISKEKKSLGFTTQELKSTDFEGNVETNIVNSLQGKLAGVHITNSQGDMGSSRIVIRGETSISGDNQPLFIVNGIPVDNSQFYQSGHQTRDFRNGIADLNPDDIESISVLKGPNAAALYGSRAGHGVVLITTKSGKGQKGLGVSVNSGITISNVTTLPKFQDVFGQGTQGQFSYVDGKGGGVNDGVDESWGPKMDGRLIPQFYSNGVPVPFLPHPNNVKDFFKTGITYDHSLAIAGSNDKHDFRLAISQQDQKGTVPNTEIKKTNFSLNTNYQLTKRIKVGATANYIITDAPNLPGGPLGARAAGVMLQFLWFGRQVDINKLKENWNNNWNNSYYSNPYWRAYYNTVEQKRNRFIGDVHFSINLLKGLDFRFRSGTDHYTDLRKYKIKTGTNGTPDGSYAEDAYAATESNTEGIFTYERNLNDDFSLEALAGFNVFNLTKENNWQKATKLATPDLFTVSNSKDPLISTNYYEKKRIYSGFFSAQLGYKGYAYLNVTGRNDISSSLPKNNRSYFYPSINASLLVSELLGLRSTALNLIKLRGGWSEVGNDTNPYQLINTYDSQPAFGGNPILTSSKVKNNPDLKPETTRSTEVGAEISLFNNRVHLDVALYNTNSINHILNVKTSAASEYTSQLLNLGKLNNKGIEVQLNLVPVKVKSFRWDLGLNYAANKSKLIELDKEGLLKNYVLGSQGVEVLAAVGEKYGVLFGTAYKRHDNGKIIVDPLNGLPQLDPTNKILGHYTPDWVGGISNTFSYKNIALSFLIDASIGGSIFSGTNQTGDYTGVLKQTLQGRDAEHGGLTYTTTNASGVTITHDDGIIVDGVTENGDPNTTIVSAEDYYHSLYDIDESHVYDASYVKLREIRLSYTFNKELIKKTGLNEITISAIARNVAFLYKKAPNIDPEAALGTGNNQGIETLSLPTTRSFGFNVSLKF